MINIDANTIVYDDIPGDNDARGSLLFDPNARLTHVRYFHVSDDHIIDVG